jgi:hypothetical protein
VVILLSRLLPFPRRYDRGIGGRVSTPWATPPEAVLAVVLALTGVELIDIARRAHIGYTVCTAILGGRRRITADEFRRLLMAVASLLP